MKLDQIKKKVQPILNKHDVKKADFFGSLVKGNANQSSDIDILIEFDNKKKKTLLDLVALKNDLEAQLNKKVDVITYDSLNPLLKDKILKERESIL